MNHLAQRMNDKLYEDKCKAALFEKREIERKMQLIKEIKELEKSNKNLRKDSNVKFDKTQTPGHGLLSEMSLAQVNTYTHFKKFLL